MPGYEIIGEEEREAVNAVFDSGGCLFRYGFDFMRKGRYSVVDFEKQFATYIRVPHAHAVSSGTAALFCVNKALGIGPGDEVITQSFTFVATVEAITETGATPVIAEIDETLNMDPADLEKKISKKTKAIWVVHMMGNPARMKEILAIGKKYGVPVLEDTAQAFGARYENRYCGTWGKAGIFSFDFGKTLTTGEGGMIATADTSLFLSVYAYADHGHEDNPKFPRGEDTATRKGFNFRMMELQGAIGQVQLKKMKQALATVKKNHDALKQRLSDIHVLTFREVPNEGTDVGDSLVFFLPTVQQREQVSEYLAGQGIGFKLLPGAVKWHFAGRWDHIWKDVPEYAEKNYLSLWPRSYDLLQRAIAIPILIKMTNKQINKIAHEINRAVATV